MERWTNQGRALLGCLALTAFALLWAGCSAQMIDQWLGNLNASICSTPATQAQFVANLPPAIFITVAQEQYLVQQKCAADFGTVPAPTPAPGQNPVFPTVGPTPVPSATPTTVVHGQTVTAPPTTVR